MLAYWCLSQNFGDRLTYWLISHITGVAPKWVSPDDHRKHLLGVGSILNHAGANSVVWGSGFASMSDAVRSGVDIRLTRGPLSALKARACENKVPDVYGDPGLLAPRFRKPSEKKHKLGIVYHYADQSAWPVVEGAKHINVLDDVEYVIDDLTECEAIVSSSLHGLVLADAYGIPAAWLHSPRVGGDGTKFADHIMALGGDPQPLTWRAMKDASVSEIVARIPHRPVKFNADAILNTFPHDIA